MINKKPGQKYSKKELLTRGWTDTLINEHLVQKKDKKGRPYYLAKDVSEKEIQPQIAALLETNRTISFKKNQLRRTSTADRIVAAEKLCSALDEVVSQQYDGSEVWEIAMMAHQAFKKILVHPQPTDKGMPTPYTEPELIKMLKDLSGRVFRSKQFLRVPTHCWAAGTGEVSPIFTAQYIKTIRCMAEKDLHDLREHNCTTPVSKILALPAVQSVYPVERDLTYCYLTYFIPGTITKALSDLLDVDPKDEYPSARAMPRRFYIHVGGTNTGKTYESLQRLQHVPSGVYLAPLRLLALEVQETLLENGVNCSLLTGEEEDIRDGATHISSTVEMLSLREKYDVAVIDECQMITNPQRGYAWTRAILGVQAPEIHLCVAPEGLDILKRLLTETGEPYEVIEHHRKVPLLWQSATVSLKQARPGDAFVAFSKKSVLQMAETLKQHGKPASIIYGDLPYATRRQQMQRFLDGETKIVVATDAIGMGLNLPIHRVIFTQDTKFDGIEHRSLNSAEVRQIAGRAGRFGIYKEGFATVGPYCRDLEHLLESSPPSATFAYLGFSELVLKVDYPLSDVLRVWNQMPVKKPYVRMDISRYIYIISLIQSVLHLDLSKEELLRAGNIPFDEKNPVVLAQFVQYIKAYAAGNTDVQKPVLKGAFLSQLETYYKLLGLYYSFAKAFHLTYDKEWLPEEKQMVADEINHLLIHELSQRGASCRICGKPLPLSSRYGICSECYHKHYLSQHNHP